MIAPAPLHLTTDLTLHFLTIMHQDHNIPWQTLATHLQISSGPEPLYTNKPLDIYPRGRPNQGKTFTYFSDALITTIHKFATTERLKYPPTFPVHETGALFSEDLIQKCQLRYSNPFNWRDGFLNNENQTIEGWI